MIEPLTPVRREDHLTFRGNLHGTRFGWLRLTPAYSVHLVERLIEQTDGEGSPRVLDPFCGTGTTALVCARRGFACDTTDINPFLIWLATAKCARYGPADVEQFSNAAVCVGRRIASQVGTAPSEGWVPPIRDVSKWWPPGVLASLARARGAIEAARVADVGSAAADLLKVAFCRTLITHANVSFGHQSMSFKRPKEDVGASLFQDGVADAVAATWSAAARDLARSAADPIAVIPRVLPCDARRLAHDGRLGGYSRIVTSPPYPNRMSYIRELRPYMYWLGFVSDGRAAGELDWEAIGGTWGCATSNLTKWKPNTAIDRPDGLRDICDRIGARSTTLGQYVLKYFEDMAIHVSQLPGLLRPGGSVHYVVGNSRFYDVLLPVERLFADLFERAGLVDVSIDCIRKRTSKRELFEFVVSARRPGLGGALRRRNITPRGSGGRAEHPEAPLVPVQR